MRVLALGQKLKIPYYVFTWHISRATHYRMNTLELLTQAIENPQIKEEIRAGKHGAIDAKTFTTLFGNAWMSFDWVTMFPPSDAGDHYKGDNNIYDMEFNYGVTIEFRDGHPWVIAGHPTHYWLWLSSGNAVTVNKTLAKKSIIQKYPEVITKWRVTDDLVQMAIEKDPTLALIVEELPEDTFVWLAENNMSVFEQLSDPPRRALVAAAAQESELISRLHPLTDDERTYLLEKNPEIITKLSSPTEDEWAKVISQRPSLIFMHSSPSLSLLKKYIDVDPEVSSIKWQWWTQELANYAINCRNIHPEYIPEKFRDEHILFEAFVRDLWHYIDIPTGDKLMEAIKRNVEVLYHGKCLTKDHMMEIVTWHADALRYISFVNNVPLDSDIIITALKAHPSAIRHVPQTEEYCHMVCRKNWTMARFIKDAQMRRKMLDMYQIHH